MHTCDIVQFTPFNEINVHALIISRPYESYLLLSSEIIVNASSKMENLLVGIIIYLNCMIIISVRNGTVWDCFVCTCTCSMYDSVA